MAIYDRLPAQRGIGAPEAVGSKTSQAPVNGIKSKSEQIMQKAAQQKQPNPRALQQSAQQSALNSPRIPSLPANQPPLNKSISGADFMAPQPYKMPRTI